MGEALRTISFKVRTASCGGTACVNLFEDEQLAVDVLADKLLFEIIVKEKGMFTNEALPSAKAKLRILFEVAPLGFLIEKAGGHSRDGYQSVLDKVINNLDDGIQVAYGSKPRPKDLWLRVSLEMSKILKNEGILRPREEFSTLWILQIIDVELDELSKFAPHTDDYRVLFWFEGNEKDTMMTGPSISSPNPTWKEEFLVRSYDSIRQSEYLKLEVIKMGKEPGTSQGLGAVARIMVALPNYYGKQSGRFNLVSTCESSVDCKSVGVITLAMEKRRIRRIIKPHN